MTVGVPIIERVDCIWSCGKPFTWDEIKLVNQQLRNARYNRQDPGDAEIILIALPGFVCRGLQRLCHGAKSAESYADQDVAG